MSPKTIWFFMLVLAIVATREASLRKISKQNSEENEENSQEDELEDWKKFALENEEKITNFYQTNIDEEENEGEDEDDEEQRIENFLEEFDEEDDEGEIKVNNTWPMVKNIVKVPYEIDPASKYNKRQRDNIEAAMHKIQSKTCVQFVERKDEKNFIKFVSDKEKGCSSFIGMKPHGQEINIYKKSEDCTDIGTIAFKIMNSLGFQHHVELVKLGYELLKPTYEIIRPHIKKTKAKGILNMFEKYVGIFKKTFQQDTLSDLEVEKLNDIYKCKKATEKNEDEEDEEEEEEEEEEDEEENEDDE